MNKSKTRRIDVRLPMKLTVYIVETRKPNQTTAKRIVELLVKGLNYDGSPKEAKFCQ